MLEKFAKLEERLNSLIQRVISFCMIFLKKIIPQTLIKKCLHFFAKINLILTQLMDKLTSGITKFNHHFQAKKKIAQEKAKQVQHFPFKQVTKEIASPAGAKKGASFIGDFIKSGFDFIEKKASNFGQTQLIMAFIATVVITVGLISVIDGAQEIAELENPTRIPASVQEYKYSPKYRLFVKRTMKVMNVKIPVYRKNVRQLRSVTVDFSVRTTTRFAKKYLEHYEAQVKDYFFTHTEPVIASFAIEEEGKDVFKEKIAIDLNNFLKENNVEGEVEEVGISFIVAN